MRHMPLAFRYATYVRRAVLSCCSSAQAAHTCLTATGIRSTAITFASISQHNKEREAWHRMKEKNPELAAQIEASSSGREVAAEHSGDSTSDDDDEVRLAITRTFQSPLQSNLVLIVSCGMMWSRCIAQGVGGTLDDQEQIRFLSVLSKIKQRDNTIYDPGTQLFVDEEDDDEEDEAEDGGEGSAGGSGQGRKEKQTRLKDVLARQARLLSLKGTIWSEGCGALPLQTPPQSTNAWPTGPGGGCRNKR